GKIETRGGFVHAAPRHRFGMAEGGLPAHPQGWCPRHRRCDGGGLCGKPGGQSLGPLGTHQVRPLPSAAGPTSIYSEVGWIAQALRPSNVRGQGMSEGDRYGFGGCVRAGLSPLLLRLPAGSLCSSSLTRSAYWLYAPRTALGDRSRHRKILRFDFAPPPALLS